MIVLISGPNGLTLPKNKDYTIFGRGTFIEITTSDGNKYEIRQTTATPYFSANRLSRVIDVYVDKTNYQRIAAELDKEIYPEVN